MLLLLLSIDVSPHPVAEHQLSKSVAFMYKEALSARTMKTAVRHKQIAMGLGDPVIVRMPQSQYVLKGACRRLAGGPKWMRLPITPEILQ